MTIFIEDSFDSAHFLPNVPDGHKCRRMHGHTYRIRLEVSGPIDPTTGWVVDYADVKALWDPLKRALDHRLLNEIKGLENPTCEIIAAWIWLELAGKLLGLSKIELRETEHCGVVYEGR
jgi:6-pyruvoyltetrahydropterin/6-carboxytetrahydropterin synthase